MITLVHVLGVLSMRVNIFNSNSVQMMSECHGKSVVNYSFEYEDYFITEKDLFCLPETCRLKVKNCQRYKC